MVIESSAASFRCGDWNRLLNVYEPSAQRLRGTCSPAIRMATHGGNARRQCTAATAACLSAGREPCSDGVDRADFAGSVRKHLSVVRPKNFGQKLRPAGTEGRAMPAKVVRTEGGVETTVTH